MHLDWECRVRFTVHYGASLVLSVDAHGKIFIAEDTGRQDFLRLSDSRCGSESWKQKTQVPARVFQDGLPPRSSLLPTLAMRQASLMVRSACSLPHMPQLHVEAGVAQRCGGIWLGVFSVSLVAVGGSRLHPNGCGWPDSAGSLSERQDFGWSSGRSVSCTVATRFIGKCPVWVTASIPKVAGIGPCTPYNSCARSSTQLARSAARILEDASFC